MDCSVCKLHVHGGIASHFRIDHQYTTDQVIEVIFEEITNLNDRVTNLCELLEIREK